MRDNKKKDAEHHRTILMIPVTLNIFIGYEVVTDSGVMVLYKAEVTQNAFSRHENIVVKFIPKNGDLTQEYSLAFSFAQEVSENLIANNGLYDHITRMCDSQLKRVFAIRKCRCGRKMVKRENYVPKLRITSGGTGWVNWATDAQVLRWDDRSGDIRWV